MQLVVFIYAFFPRPTLSSLLYALCIIYKAYAFMLFKSISSVHQKTKEIEREIHILHISRMKEHYSIDTSQNGCPIRTKGNSMKSTIFSMSMILILEWTLNSSFSATLIFVLHWINTQIYTHTYGMGKECEREREQENWWKNRKRIT